MRRFTATAYCQEGKTRTGARTRAGIVAADPGILPLGSVVRIYSPKAYAGTYTVMDTGAAVRGHRLDIFIPDCARAKRFGRQTVQLKILRRGSPE
jgi:rare lipoprotein A